MSPMICDCCWPDNGERCQFAGPDDANGFHQKVIMRLQWLVVWIVVVAVCGVCKDMSADAADLDGFQPKIDFLHVPEGWTLGACSAVDLDRQGNVYLFHRGKHPIIGFDATGRFQKSWGDDLIKTPHGLRIDRPGDIWVTDIGNHRVFKFDSSGKLMLALGTGKAGEGDDEFNQPTDVAFGPEGEVFISDGYGNNRVKKYSADGKLLTIWGRAGKGPGEFHLPHAIVVDSSNRVLVGDRENNRIQVFDREGALLEIWPGFAPYGLAFGPDNVLYVATGREYDVLCLDSKGAIKQRWGRKGMAAGEFDLPHMLAVDPAGSLFVAEVGGKRLQKLSLK